MTPSWFRSTSAALALLALSVAAAAQDEARPPLALMGTIPIYWGEAGELSDLLNGGAAPHWARAVLERGFTLVPLDTLTADALAGHDRLLLAQPRTLSAAENVALDAWVRAGGHLLLFADPLMTGESRFGIGDRRRPQDVTLLSPLLNHWGLDLQFPGEDGLGLKPGDAGVTGLPVNLPGRLVGREGSECAVLGDGLAARCALGSGEALVVADAAVLDHEGPWPGAERGLAALVDSVFAVSIRANGEIGELSPAGTENGGILPFSHNGNEAEGHADPP